MKERIINNGSNDKSVNFNYFNFFEYAPIALWIEDFSKAKLFNIFSVYLSINAALINVIQIGSIKQF